MRWPFPHLTRRCVLTLALLIAPCPLATPAGASTNSIYTVAGDGTGGYAGDGGPATAAHLNQPVGVAVAPDGSLIVADLDNHRVRRVAPTGIITTIAGDGTGGYAGDGGPATAAHLNEPTSVAVAPDGSIVIADPGSSRVRRVSTAGTVTTIAGDGTAGFAGDGGPATAARLNYPSGVGVASDGSVIIADSNNHRVRRISPAGIITTIAGDGTAGFSGDGGPATASRLRSPLGVAASPDGGVLIADADNHRVRRIGPTGTITTIAGGDTRGFGGDGGPATAARMSMPSGVAPAADGSIIIADLDNHRVRRVSPTGVITTIAGNGLGLRFSGDGVPATTASLAYPSSVAVLADGSVAIADQANQRVRLVDAGLAPGLPGLAGGPGAPGLAGVPGLPGPAGDTVVQPAGVAAPLRAALVDPELTGTTGRTVQIRLAVSAAADVSLTVARGRTVIAKVTRSVRAGRSNLTWRAKTRGRNVRAGRYTLSLRAVGDDAQATTVPGRLTLVRPAKRQRPR